MDRRDRILAGLDVARLTGIEIGALDRPLVRPGSGGAVLYVDHADTPALRRKYATDPGVDLDALVEVDVVWGENTLREALQARAATHPDAPVQVDYVIASHVIEHVPDLLGWLGEIHEVLKPSGQLRLAMPDRRFTFDCLREDTRLSDVLAAHLVGVRRPTPQAILDGQLNAVPAANTVKLWNGDEDAALAPSFDWNYTVRAVRGAVAGEYHDVHCWAVSPYSLADVFVFLAERGLLRLACDSFEDTAFGDNEFHLRLVPNADPGFVAETWRRVRRAARQTMPGSRFRPIDVLSGAVSGGAVVASADSRELAEQRRLAHERLILAQSMEARALAAENLAEERLYLAQNLEARALTAEARALGAEGALDEVRRSTSWRLTEPLRSAMRFLRGRRRPEAPAG
jgi:SAM-dependent methyltransferase